MTGPNILLRVDNETGGLLGSVAGKRAFAPQGVGVSSAQLHAIMLQHRFDAEVLANGAKVDPLG